MTKLAPIPSLARSPTGSVEGGRPRAQLTNTAEDPPEEDVGQLERPRPTANRITFLERRLPYRELSLIAKADRRATDPVYAAHRWWARRPPGVIRGLLLAAALPGDATIEAYWSRFASDEPILSGLRVHDLFVGGGTTIVEAARLGAQPSGTDVDPLAIEIVKHELERADARAVSTAAHELLTFLEKRLGHLFSSGRRTALHYFYLHEVECPQCELTSPLYRTLVIARASGKRGGVVRDSAVVAFCPDCFKLHHYADPERWVLRCCERRRLNQGNFFAQHFSCPACGHRSTHRDLQTGRSRRRLLAIEEATATERRSIRAATNQDRKLLEAAARYLNRHRGELLLPSQTLATDRRDSRPISFGITHPLQLFSDRQLAVFGHAFRWVAESDHSSSTRRALTLALSNALTTNNKLCSYATEYGRLAPLFSVRSYALPILPVELNPFHPSAGRGTLRRIFARIARIDRSVDEEVRRYVWSTQSRRPVLATMCFPVSTPADDVVCASAAAAAPAGAPKVDICLFDPPYFDYIAYSELSEFYRCWLGYERLGGKPLLPDRIEPVASFGESLGDCLVEALHRLRFGRPLVFTYHSASPLAWKAISMALDKAAVRVTGIWPVRNDSHMGHHTADGNCEWDLVIACRRVDECVPRPLAETVSAWRRAVRPLRISLVDAQSMKLAIEMAAGRFGAPSGRLQGVT